MGAFAKAQTKIIYGILMVMYYMGIFEKIQLDNASVRWHQRVY